MGFSEAVQWWEEWQLRVLVLASGFLQFFLFFAGILRKRCIPSWLRFLIWLGYLSSDAVAIYALATLFNRHKTQEWVSTHENSAKLQALWAPILLIHLGGADGITAYSIEDNELWRRHVLTAVSQVAVAVYVFRNSWPQDKRTLATGLLLFFVGILKCIFKPWDLKRVSINSLVDDYSVSEVDSSAGSEENRKIVISSLDQYVRAATEYFHVDHPWDSTPVILVKPDLLFVDLAPPYFQRLKWLKFLVHNPDTSYNCVRFCLSQTFDRLYTKESLLFAIRYFSIMGNWLGWITFLKVLVTGVSFAIISLIFMEERIANYRKPSKDTDVTITFILISLAGVLDYILPYALHIVPCDRQLGKGRWPDEVAQYNLIEYLVRNKKHRKLRRLATLLVCKDNIDQLWCMKPSTSSREITKIVHDYIAKGWTEHHIKDMATYRAFNDNRGQWTLKQEGCGDSLAWSLRRHFDESVLLWHLATDFCFHLMHPHTSRKKTIRRCREMSNYMVYLLFVNPEMLMTGARRSLFRAAYKQLKMTLTLKPQQSEGDGETVGAERALAQKIEHNIKHARSREGSQNIQHATVGEGSQIIHEATGHEDLSIVNDAWDLAQELKELHSKHGEKKMWKVIQGVWVEMLCFSAGRCRGYLHAKSLGKGGEFLSYIWLLMSHMGMETLAERMQTTKLQEEETTNNGGSSNATTAASPAVATGGSATGTTADTSVTVPPDGGGDGTAAAPPASLSPEGDDMV